MNRSKSKRVNKKKAIPLHFQKSQASLSQILSTASYKKRIKELQKNNKILAVALQDTRLDLANSNKLLQQHSNADAKIWFAKAKLKDMVACIQTLVSSLNEVMCSLDLRPVSFFNSSADEIRMKIREPDLDPIEESTSVVEESNLSSIDKSLKETTDVQLNDSPIGLNTVVEDQVTSRPYNSVPHALPPDSPLTPELEISPSAEYFNPVMDLNLTCQSPEKISIPKGKLKLKSMSRIPKKTNPLNFKPIDFSPPAPKINRKTFVKDAPTCSELVEICTSDSSQDVDHRDRRGTFVIPAAPEKIPTVVLDRMVLRQEPDATMYLNEDMELTGLIPINNKPAPKKDTIQVFNATDLPSSNHQLNDMAKSIDNTVMVEMVHPLGSSKPESSKLISNKQDSLDKTAFSIMKTTKNISPKSKCPDFNEDMELTNVIPICNLPTSEFNISVEPEHFVATSKLNSSKLLSDILESPNEPIPFGIDIAVSMKDNSPNSKKSEIKESLKRKSVSHKKVSFKTKERKFSDPKNNKTSNKKRQPSVNSKQISSPKSPEMSREVGMKSRRSSINSKQMSSPQSPKVSREVGIETISPKNLEITSTTSSRKSLRENPKSYKEFFSSDSDWDNEIFRNNKKVKSKISLMPKSNLPTNFMEPISHSEANLLSEESSCSGENSVSDSSKKAKDSISIKDSELTLDCNSKDDFKSFGRCNLKSPKKTSKTRGPFKFKKTTEKGNEQITTMEATCNVTSESSTFKIKHISPQKLNTSESLKINSFSESSDNADKEIASASENLSPVLRSKTCNKDVDKSSKGHNQNRKSARVKLFDQKTGTNEIVKSDIKSSRRTSALSLSKEKSMAVEAQCDSLGLEIVSPPDKNRTATSTCRKSVQFAFDDCYSAFQGIKCKKQLMHEHKGSLNISKEIGKNNDSEQRSSTRSATCLPGILKKKASSQILNKTVSSDTSVHNIEKQKDSPLKPLTEADNKLTQLLATLDSTFSDDSGHSSKGKTYLDSDRQPTKSDQVKRPFSGVSERRSKRRATDNSTDVFVEIESMCSQEIHPQCLPAAQQSQMKDTIDHEKTEINDLKNVIAKDFETEFKQSHSPRPKNKSKKLKGKVKNLNSENLKSNILVQDTLVGNDKAKSSHQAVKLPDSTAYKSNKKKKCKANVEVDFITSSQISPLKQIQLSSTKACTSSEINVKENKVVDKPRKIQTCALTENETKLNDSNLQPTVVLETLPSCISEYESSARSIGSTSSGNTRSRRERQQPSYKEPSLNKKMRR